VSVVLSDPSFTFPNGRPVLSKLSAAFGPGRTGLTGVNGSGKSTLLRLIAGDQRLAAWSAAAGGHGPGAARGRAAPDRHPRPRPGRLPRHPRPVGPGNAGTAGHLTQPPVTG